MAQNFKVNQLAKDLGVKNKELVDILADKGYDVKTQKSLEPAEFDVLFDTLTKANQVSNIDDYISGVTYIPSRLTEILEKAEAEKAAAEKAAAEKAAAEKAAAEKAAAEKAAAEKAAAEKAAAEKAAAEKAAAEKAAADKAAAERAAAERAAAEKKRTQNVATDNRRNDRPVGNNNGMLNRFGDSSNSQGQRTQSDKFNQNRQGNDRFQRNDNRGTQPQNGNNRFDGNRNGGNDRINDRGDSRIQGQNNRGDRFGSRQGGDKDDYVQNAPRERFQAQPIYRGDTPKGGETNPKQRGATRIVDTRATDINLSKYDEKLDTFVNDKGEDRAGNTKLKKQAQKNLAQEKQNRQQGGQQFGGRSDNRFGGKKQSQAPKAPIKKQPVNIAIPDEIVVSDLAQGLKVTAAEVVKRLMLMGMMVTVNQTIDFDTAAIVADDLGAVVTKQQVVTIEEKLFDMEEDKESDLVSRAPVVCVMGHVDHGKTSLLDAIRHTNVTLGEAGGITQHIGAYRVSVNGQNLTFLDTPGHEAFTAMRARGAQATDIAILVVAADDGIMPQTVEAINHAKAAGIDIIVAINKMDKPGANPDNIKQELTKYDLVPEEWGGDVICCPVSALTKMGIEDLLENVLLVAEVKDLKANPNRRAKGLVIEAKLDRGRGPVATVLVQNGTLKSGDIVIAGSAVGRVRAMTDHNGKPVKVAGPSVPVEITGLADVPLAGDEFAAVEDEKMARELADRRKNKAKEDIFKANARANLNDLFAQISEGVKDLNIIVKADVGGSAEAVKQSLEKLSNEEVKVRVIHSAAGGITEGDVMLAAASNAIVVGFNVRPDSSALASAERQNVEIRSYRVIYECIEEITAAMKGMLAPKFREVLLGHAEVRQTIHVPGVGTIAGSYLKDGKISRTAQIRVVRDGIVIFEDKVSSLKRFKDDVREVAEGYECGVGLERFNDIKVGDILEAFIMEEIER